MTKLDHPCRRMAASSSRPRGNSITEAAAMIRAFILLLLTAVPAAHASIPAAPDRTEGEGPWPQLILRGVTVISGTGAPAYGPLDIVIEGDRIANVGLVG